MRIFDESRVVVAHMGLSLWSWRVHRVDPSLSVLLGYVEKFIKKIKNPARIN